MKQYYTEGSKKLFNELKEYLVDGVSSSFHVAEGEEYPICMRYGRGSKLYDVDGNEYIDYVLGFGPVILGHGNKALEEALKEQVKYGTQYSSPTYQLLELSQALTQIIPCAEKVIYQNTGTEAVMSAFRVARGFTGKSKIIKFEGQYHGWSDEEKVTIDADKVADLGPIDNINKILTTKGQRPAAVDDIIIAPWNDLKALELIFQRESDIACVVMEPVMYDSGPIMPKDGYLQAVKELCEKHGALLYFDEVITGFRMALGGAQEYYGVTPHIATFAKAITSGVALSVVCGRRDIMDAGVHASGTYNANALSVAAALATIKELSKTGTYEKFQSLGDSLCEGLRALGQKYKFDLYCNCKGSIVTLQFGVKEEATTFREFIEKADVEKYQKLFLLATKYGLRLTSKRGRIYLSTAHTQADIEKTIEILDVIFAQL